MFTPKRPNPKETDEDILKQEKLFLQSLQRNSSGESFEPAAKVIKRQPCGGSKTNKPHAAHSGTVAETCSEDEMDTTQAEDEISEHPIQAVLSSTVVERAFDMSKLMDFQAPNPLESVPCILPIKTIPTASSSSKRAKGKSLFAQSFDAKQSNLKKMSTTVGQAQLITAKTTVEPEANVPLHPYLAGMTEEEILVEQKKLIDKLDPKLVEFIRMRKNKQPYQETMNDCDNPDSEIRSSDSTMNSEPQKLPQVGYDEVMDDSDLPIDPRSVKGIPGMDRVELKKLEWMGLHIDKDIAKTMQPDVGANARFDFNGHLLTAQSYKDESTFDKGLHHHGDEMDRAGYTLEELLTLSRSSNTQQSARALQTVGNIFANAHTGTYDRVFDKNIFELLNNIDFIYAIRKGLDAIDKTLINMGIHCLASILYPWEEEVYLDLVYLWENAKPHPWISTRVEDVKMPFEPAVQEGEMKDFEILQIDLIEFLVERSSLLQRIEYFLKESDILTESSVQGILRMLIRIARHSPNTLMKHEDLLRVLMESYATSHWNIDSARASNLRDIPLWMVLKLFRILIDSSCTNAAEIHQKFNLLPSILSYLAYEDWNSADNVQMPEYLIMESFRIWIAFLTQGIALDAYIGFFPILMRFLVLYQKSNSLTDFDLVHSSHLLSLLLAILKMKEDVIGVKEKDKHSHWDLVKDCVLCVEQFVIKLGSIISAPHLQSTFDNSSAFWALSRGLLFLVESSKHGKPVSADVIGVIKSLLCSETYTKLTSNLRKSSVVLSPSEEDRYSPNFASVKAVRFGGSLNPIVEFGRGLPLLASICVLQKTVNCFSLSDIFNSNVKGYVSDFLQSNSRGVPTDFFVRFELSYVLELVQLYPSESSSDQFYLAYKAVSEIPKCCSKLFNNMFKLALTYSCSANNLETCYIIYGGYFLENAEAILSANENVPKKKVTFSENTKLEDGPRTVNICFKTWTERSVGPHWILEPLRRIHTIVTNTPNFISKNLDEIEMQCKVCLEIIEKCLREHCDFIIQSKKDFVDVYCVVSLVFLLGDPRIYFGDEVSGILIHILQLLTNCRFVKNNPNQSFFSKQRQVEGLPNKFFDFYPDLVKEYAENSYFNTVFASYLLVPLRIQEDYQIKSNFWIMDNIRFIKIGKEESIVPLEFLTTGVEQDTNLLGIWMNILHTKKLTKEGNAYLFEVVRLNLQNAVQNGSSSDKIAKLRDAFMQLHI